MATNGRIVDLIVDGIEVLGDIAVRGGGWCHSWTQQCVFWGVGFLFQWRVLLRNVAAGT